MDCGLPGQSKVFAFCPLLLNCMGREASSEGAGELLLLAPPALTRVLTSAVCFRSAQFEHTIVITSGGAQILTKLPHEA